MQKGKLYTLLITLSLCGYVWLAFSMNKNDGQGLWQGCLSKQFLHIPCPSCGTTRSVIAILNGDLLSALLINPIGYLAGIGLAAIPLWITFDCITRKDSLFVAYNTTLAHIKKKHTYIPLIILVILNWIWNIIKYS
ncbi:MAG: DUF2752 domain-containing protein [Bacteroidaceae bacterium]|jgi:hypothetical protein|nr:DUF2752 domain-containing protein [Bacteroidaceae bacterium]